MTTKTQTNAMVPTILASLEKANYVISGPEDIAALTAASLIGGEVPATYLKVLIANVQVRSGMNSPRTTVLRGKLPTVEDTKADLEVISAVHAEFYSQILRTIIQRDPSIADEKGLRKPEAKRRAQERNKRSNYARQAKSVLTKYVKAGGNFRALCVCSVTKQSLRRWIRSVQRSAGEVTPQEEAKRYSSRLVRIVESIREESEALAQLTAQEVIAKLADMFGDKTTTSLKKAAEEGIILKRGGSMFWPVQAEHPPAHMTQ